MSATMTSGFGQFHTDEPGKKNPKPYVTVDFKEIRKLVDNPQQVDKASAQWGIPSSYKSRKFKVQEELGEYWMLWADLDKDPKPITFIHDMLNTTLNNCEHEIYTTRSATPENQKARILIPLSKPLCFDDWVRCQEILNDKLKAVGITPDRSTQRAAQLCYLPNRGEFYDKKYNRFGFKFDPISAWGDECEDKRRALEDKKAALEVNKIAAMERRAALKINGSTDAIGAFNSAYSVQEILLKASYEQRGDTFRHPASESGSFSASVKDGRVNTLSSSDPLYTEGAGAHDAFSAFTVLVHNGDLNAALQDAGDNWLSIEGEPYNKVKQREFMQDKELAKTLKHTRKDLVTMIEATSDFDELTKAIPKLISSCDLTECDRDHLWQIISKKAKVSVASLKEEAKRYKHSAAERDNCHLNAAREVIQSYGAKNLIESNSFTWLWNGDGVWRKINEREIKQRVHEISENSKLTAATVGSVMDMVKTEAYLPNHQFDINPQGINCKNGELNYLDGEWVLLPHERSHYSTAMLPVAYDKDAKAPRFEQFIKEIFKGDTDSSDKAAVVLEALGYTLIPSCHLEKFFMLIGSGANGKSVLLTILAELIGRDYATAVQPSQFENRFQRGHLQGKLANIITEIAEGAEIADAQLKSMVSGEMTTAEHKHKDPFDFVPYAKHWFGTNHLPHTRDFSDALFRRAIILKFNNKFEGKKCDVHLINKLKSELPGILNLALSGLQRLLDYKVFTSCASSIEIAQQWRREADQVAQFVEEACETGTLCHSTSYALFSSYQNWAHYAGVKRTLNRNNFTNRLGRLGYDPSRGAGGVRMISGVRPRDGSEISMDGELDRS